MTTQTWAADEAAKVIALLNAGKITAADAAERLRNLANVA